MKHKWISSLRYKQVFVLIIGAVISFGVYFASQAFGDYLVSRNHMNEDAAWKRLTGYQTSFENYINKYNISVKNVRSISKWVKNHKYVYVTIFNGNEIIYESGFWNDAYAPYETASSIGESSKQAIRDISFSDGTYSVSIIDSSEIKWYNLVTYISWGVFFLFLFVILIFYNHRIIARIMLLSKEVSLIEKGDLEQPIFYKGNDEIALLAKNADNMRNSIITRYKSEKEAWEANSELITSMSHDIRTPLTSLIGYLEILDSKSYHSEEQFDKYIKSCRDKSIQLKDLSDRLFQYFLVFGKEKIMMQMETFDAKILLQQLLMEYVFDLGNLGLDVKTEFVEESCSITADIQYLRRLFDNLFSNVRKYAGNDGPVFVKSHIDGDDLIITISNEIRRDSMFLESTNIGLKTCLKIVEQMNGTFEIQKNRTNFEVRVTFPIEPDREE
ncbi:Signal transduction histidine kinase [Lacrimispora sphenoides]|uniref:HAMP domain-containing sensor histidine kinase n=1 Tax=Lacrimispora sphenoides TaxID=29370 RepID=UPI0008CEF6EF|nr:HAMP domain-containing sensor histidine kinase [Lacrimispora sphenoides]SEU12745.1 Signal transduction histidine kinase [Lacrimispora sphenoides]